MSTFSSAHQAAFDCLLSGVFVLLFVSPLPGQKAPVAAAVAKGSTSTSILLTVENEVQVALGKGAWLSGKVGQALNYGDRVRTGEYSRG